MSIRALMPLLTALIIGAVVVVVTRSMGLSNNDRRAIHAWLICDDCRSGERAAVAYLGDDAVPVLAEALVGPSQDQQRIMRGKFDTSFKVADIATRVPGFLATQYSEFRDQNYRANYQKRAATSLGDIGGDKARRALDQAIADSASRNYRADVIRVIKFSRSRLDAVTYSGQLYPYRSSFGDPVRVVADSFHFTPQAQIVIEDSLFPPSDIPIQRVGDTLIVFPAVAPFGVHVISVKPGGNAPDGKLGIFVESIVDPADRTSLCKADSIPCMINSAPPIWADSPAVFLTLSSGTEADSYDFYKIANPSPIQVTAKLDWRGTGRVELSWKECGTGTSLGNPVDSSTPGVLSLSAQIPSGECRLLQVRLTAGNGPIYGKLNVTSP